MDDDENLIFIPNEWISTTKRNNTSKMYQVLKDNGFIVPAFYKAGQVVEALEKFEEYIGTDFGFDVFGCRIEVENADTIDSLFEIMKDENISEYLHKIILLG